MDIGAIVSVLPVLLFPLGLFAIVKAIYHTWFVVTNVRPSKSFQASLLGPFCLLVPSLFEEKAQKHLSHLRVWLPVAAGSTCMLLLLKAIGNDGQ